MAYKVPDLATLDVSRTNIKHVLELEENQVIFNSSTGKDVVVFVGNTGSGKSTLINYLVQKELIVDENDNIILKNPSDLSAMKIGVGSASETLLPQFIECNQLLLYDLPGFKDTRGTVVNLLNAAFIKNIVENAKTVRIIFVIAMDEINANRGELFKEILKSIETLIPNKSINDISGIVVTKTPAGQSMDKLVNKVNLCMDNKLTKWQNEKRFANMETVHNESINQNNRKSILEMINTIKQEHIENVNIGTIFSFYDSNTVKGIYIEEMQEVFNCLIKEKINTTEIKNYKLTELVNKKNELKKFIDNCTFDSSTLISILKTISEDVYNTALIEFKKIIINDIEKIVLLIKMEIKEKERLKFEKKYNEEVCRLISENEKFEIIISSLRAEIKNIQQNFEEKLKEESYKKQIANQERQIEVLELRAEIERLNQKVDKTSRKENFKGQFAGHESQNNMLSFTDEAQINQERFYSSHEAEVEREIEILQEKLKNAYLKQKINNKQHHENMASLNAAYEKKKKKIDNICVLI